MRYMQTTLIGAVVLFLLSATAIEAVETAMVPMSDGVKIATDLYFPADQQETYYTILIRTPYGKNGYRSIASHFTGAGYAVVVQDVRGKDESEGEFMPFVNERADGLETLSWIAGQTWSNGSVGIWGPSYLGLAGLVVADGEHPALKSVLSASGWIEGDDVLSPGGAINIMLALPWLLLEETERQKAYREYDIADLFEYLPLSGAFESVGVKSGAWGNWEVLEANHAVDYSRISIPIFHITSWYDFIAPAAFDSYRKIGQFGSAEQTLLVGPWMHNQLFTDVTEVGEADFGETSVFGTDKLLGLSVQWFDQTLRGIDRGIRAEGVEVFLMGPNEWVDLDAWPPSRLEIMPLHLVSEGDPRDPDGGGMLIADAPKEARIDSFVFDPNDPVPTHGGANFHFFPQFSGVRDQREIEARADVLSYTTTALEKPIDIIGSVRTVLYVSTEGRDTDFTARLVEVKPDGRAMNIVDGIRRLSARHGRQGDLVEPGQVIEITIEMGETAIRIPAGSRLRLDVSSSNFPKFDRNPNTGELPIEATELVAVINSVHHSPDHPSRVEIPVWTSGSRRPVAGESERVAKVTTNTRD